MEQSLPDNIENVKEPKFIIELWRSHGELTKQLNTTVRAVGKLTKSVTALADRFDKHVQDENAEKILEKAAKKRWSAAKKVALQIFMPIITLALISIAGSLAGWWTRLNDLMKGV